MKWENIPAVIFVVSTQTRSTLSKTANGYDQFWLISHYWGSNS